MCFPITNPAGWSLTKTAQVDTSTGEILAGNCAGEILQSIDVTSSEKDDLLRMNEEIVTMGGVEGSDTKFQGGGKGEKKAIKNLQKRREEWNKFKKFLRANTDFDIVIDGANVGYYKALTRHVNYRQINQTIKKLKRMGHKPLLILHSRHFAKNMIPKEDEMIVNDWKRGHCLYIVPAGSNDDWFWLAAALNLGGFVLTNDEMRDHQYQQRASRSFYRWIERKRVKFFFPGWNEKDPKSNKEIVKGEMDFDFPKKYSVRMQRRDQGGLFIPLSEEGHSFMCIKMLT